MYFGHAGIPFPFVSMHTAGQERFRTITVSYFRGAHGIFLVFDITERHTFQSVEQWIEQIQQSADGSINLLLVGNKCDCEDSARQVSYAEGVEAARRIGCKYLETSARTRVNIKEAFETLALDTKNRYLCIVYYLMWPGCIVSYIIPRRLSVFQYSFDATSF
jgi:small GTP-binding protein